MENKQCIYICLTYSEMGIIMVIFYNHIQSFIELSVLAISKIIKYIRILQHIVCSFKTNVLNSEMFIKHNVYSHIWKAQIMKYINVFKMFLRYCFQWQSLHFGANRKNHFLECQRDCI